ncbi:hypothetical protein [Allosphingosinicella sp.]|uniref:hypothetical protein n=1 Tax=Allosphingosinicella sp. TaxID=2823234 RepID=UPI0037835AF5
MSRVRRQLRIIACALLALTMILSAAAWGAHRIDRMDELAAAAAAPAGHGHAPDPYGGHDHLQGFSHPVAALLGGPELTPPPLPAAAPPAERTRTLAFRPADPPLPDPPRTA